MDAPDAETAQCVHREAHGFVASEVVEVALSAVEAFLGRIQDPTPREPAPKHMDAGHRAILFTDIVGSTEMTARLGDRMAAELVRAHDALVRGCLVRRSGREVKHTGLSGGKRYEAGARGAQRLQRQGIKKRAIRHRVKAQPLIQPAGFGRGGEVGEDLIL